MDALDTRDMHQQLERAFGEALTLPEGQATPFEDWRELSRLVVALAKARHAKVIAICGSQGSGKTTLAEVVTRTFNVGQTRDDAVATAVTCSLDDFYLSKQARADLARNVHPLLETRGVPGTHDWQWLGEVLNAVKTGSTYFKRPVFDKATDDRSGVVSVEAEVLVIEGWCLGVTPQPEEQVSPPCNGLERSEDKDGRWRRYVNSQIETHYQPLWASVDLWVHLRVPSFEKVIEWRTLQEQQLPQEARMSEAELIKFVQHYERLTRWIGSSQPIPPGLKVDLDEHHAVQSVDIVV